MHYEHKELGFSFNLPDGWRYDEGNIAAVTFYGPNGSIGCSSELIQIRIGTIKPQYFDPDKRVKFLAEPGAKVLRSRVGDETNVVVMRKANDSEISVIRDGIHYVICHFNDADTEMAIALLKQSVRFPSPEKAAAAIQGWADPRRQAVGKVLRAGSPEEARRILSESGMSASIQRPGYTMHRAEEYSRTSPSMKRDSAKKWWQFWK